MINLQAHKMIRLLYERQGEVWHLALMETSDGVAKLMTLPHFNPGSPQPKRQHLKEILDALAEAEFDAGSLTEAIDDTSHEVMIEIKRRHERQKFVGPTAIVANGDKEHHAQQQLKDESNQRLSTNEGSRHWLSVAQERVNSPDLLYAGLELKR